jgi:pimeloyl-ACP methyl ester carboxylesterase
LTTHADITPLVRGRAAEIGYLRRAGRGKARTLLLLHGIGSNAGSFSALMAALPPSIDAIAWDAPGYGDSRPLALPSPTPRDYADSVKALLDALGVRRATVGGHSLGALFAASFAAHCSEKVAALALLSPANGYRVAPGAALPPAVQARIDEIYELGPVAFAAKRAPRLVGDPAANPQIVAAVEKAMAAVHPGAYAQAVLALGAGDLISDLAQISAPALVGVGTKDVITPPDNAQRAHDHLRNSVGFHLISGAGHALPQEEPTAVAQLLTRLVEEHADA